MMDRRVELCAMIRDGGIGVELGVAEGEFSEKILANSKLSKLYSVDAWAGDRGHDNSEHMKAFDRLVRFGTRNHILKMRFGDACKTFPDAHFDFIYIDGYAHTGQEDGKTLDDWWPKLKKHGIFGGHDYDSRWPETQRTVDLFVAKHDLELFGILDNPFSSWYVIKP